MEDPSIYNIRAARAKPAMAAKPEAADLSAAPWNMVGLVVLQVALVVWLEPADGFHGVGCGDAATGAAGLDLAGGGADEDLTGAAGFEEAGAGVQVGVGLTSVTGQTVVETGMTEVTTLVLWAGQLVTVSAQLVMV